MEATLDGPVWIAFHPPHRLPNRQRLHRRAAPLWAVLALAACSEPPVPLTAAAAFEPPAAITPERIAAVSTTPAPQTTTPTPAAGPARPHDLTLLGTTLGTRDGFAVVRRDGSPQSFQVRVGDAVDGRIVTAIEFDRIVLASDATRGDNAAAVVHLDIAAAAPSPTEPAAQRPAAGSTTPAPIYSEPETVVAGH